MPRLSLLYFKGERLRERLLDGLREELRLRGRRVRVESSSGRGPETVSIVQNNEKQFTLLLQVILGSRSLPFRITSRAYIS